ncbi:MAG: exsB protein [Elusimicrobia bacterium]|nr:MAG: exsB protein [Elusimicrobiota bacterium]KAF0157532.1 MAG: exsB protein [Elusimicrobiota bacterium]
MQRTFPRERGAVPERKVAYEPGEARAWRGRAVVIDLFRFSNTVCALLESGRRDVRVYADPSLAVAAARASKADLFSEMDLPGVEKYDNSPVTALSGSDPAKAAVIVTNSGSKAVMACPSAAEILIGCFANAAALSAHCAASPMSTLFVPACLYYDRAHAEDFSCARFLAGEMSYGDAVAEIHSSGRPLDFLAGRPGGRRDLEMSLSKDLFTGVPSASHRGIFAPVFPAAAGGEK